MIETFTLVCLKVIRCARLRAIWSKKHHFPIFVAQRKTVLVSLESLHCQLFFFCHSVHWPWFLTKLVFSPWAFLSLLFTRVKWVKTHAHAHPLSSALRPASCWYNLPFGDDRGRREPCPRASKVLSINSSARIEKNSFCRHFLVRCALVPFLNAL